MYSPFRNRPGSDLEDLRSALERATSIVAACREVETYLKNNREPSRDFFKDVFPLLLRKIFGFEAINTQQATAVSQMSTSAGGWLGVASRPGNEADAKALISLLSPTSDLFQLLVAADKEGGIQFLFPSERLPEFVRRLLSSEQGALLLCQELPLYRSRIIQDVSGLLVVQLDLFDYFAFWFAYYAVCKDVISRSGTRRSLLNQQGKNLPQKTPLRTHLENWKSALPGLQSPGSNQLVNPYQELLILYLSHFAPRNTPPGPLPRSLSRKGSPWGRGASPAGPGHLSPGGSSGGEKVYGDVLLSSLIEFWFIDDDPMPLPWTQEQIQQMSQAIGSSIINQLLPPVYAYLPPREDLLDFQMALVGRINSTPSLSTISPLAPLLSSSSDSPLRRTSGSYDIRKISSPNDWSPGVISSPHWQDPYNQNRYSPNLAPSPDLPIKSQPQPLPLPPPSQALVRPLYRYLLRAFTNWPLDSSVGKIAKVVDLWLLYLEPWKVVSAKNSAKPGVGPTGLPANTGSPAGRLAGRLLGSAGVGNGSGGASLANGMATPGEQGSGAFSATWQGYVLANYPFYNALAMHFLEFSIKAVQIDLEMTLRTVHKALSVLDNPALLELLKRMQSAYSQYLQGGSFHHARTTKQLLDWTPVIHKELQEWEDTPLVEGASLAHPLALHHRQAALSVLRLFSQDDTGGGRLLQVFLARAEIEMQSSPASPPPAIPELIFKTRELARRVFNFQAPNYGVTPGMHAVTPEAGPHGAGKSGGARAGAGQAGTAGARGAVPPDSADVRGRAETGRNGQSFQAKDRNWLRRIAVLSGLSWGTAALQSNRVVPPGDGQGAAGEGLAQKDENHELRKHTWADVRYRGDYMRRPIEGHEVAILVRLLVRLSDALNAALGLDLGEGVSGSDTAASGQGNCQSGARVEDESGPSNRRPGKEPLDENVEASHKGKQVEGEGEGVEKRQGGVGGEETKDRPSGSTPRGGLDNGGRSGTNGESRSGGGGGGGPDGGGAEEVQPPEEGTREVDWETVGEAARWLIVAGLAKSRLVLGHAQRLGLAVLRTAGQVARRRGWRVNLRPLAEVQVLVLLASVMALYLAMRAVFYG